MRLFRRKKIEIKLSKERVRVAVELASYDAARIEITKQIHEQIQGTWVQGAPVFIPESQPLAIQSPKTELEWPKIPDSQDLTFEWIGQ